MQEFFPNHQVVAINASLSLLRSAQEHIQKIEAEFYKLGSSFLSDTLKFDSTAISQDLSKFISSLEQMHLCLQSMEAFNYRQELMDRIVAQANLMMKIKMEIQNTCFSQEKVSDTFDYLLSTLDGWDFDIDEAVRFLKMCETKTQWISVISQFFSIDAKTRTLPILFKSILDGFDEGIEGHANKVELENTMNKFKNLGFN